MRLSRHIYNFTQLLRRAKDVFRTEGLIPLLIRGSHFARRGLFLYVHYYLFQCRLDGIDEAKLKPVIQDFNLEIVSSNKQADELAASMGFDFRQHLPSARKSLDGGSIAFCVFTNGEIAHSGWVALSENAKKSMLQLPYTVDFSNGEACTGGMWTNPKYRRMGLATYVYLKRCQFLRDSGIRVTRNAVTVDNVTARRLLEKCGARIYTEGHYLRIAGWVFNKEKKLNKAAD
ncbi:GNAT family N-acetyltransferase [Chloroflexota bacterium]